MNCMTRIWFNIILGCLVLGGALTASADGTNRLVWNRSTDRVDADVRDYPLLPLLERVASQTGWHIFVEPAPDFRASTKFKDQPSGEALHRLLKELNYVLVPQTNDVPRLYVFRSAIQNATQTVRAAPPEPRRVPRELVIRVKPGTDVEALARHLGAKITGRIPELNTYRLEFDDEAATDTARKELASNSNVTSVGDNYFVDLPDGPHSAIGANAADSKLKLDPPKSDDCKVIVGFVDTGLPTMSKQLEPFIKERVSVAGPSATDANLPTHAVTTVSAFYQAIQATGKASTSVQVISVDAFGSSGSANTFNVAAGMITAGNKGATLINASLGGYGDSPVLHDAVQQLAAHNIPVFAAVGNDGSSSAFYPAAYPEVISVTAVQQGKVASYANVGTQPDVAAPGTVLFPFDGLNYVAQGTSISSAAAAGVAAGMADGSCQPWSKVIPALEKAMTVPAAK